MSRILAIDYGKKRTGVAVTDVLQIIANGLTTVPTHQLLDFILKYVEKEPVERIVVGHPKQMNNQESDNMRNIVPFVNQLKKRLPGMPVEFVDERFTSVLAHQAMLDGLNTDTGDSAFAHSTTNAIAIAVKIFLITILVFESSVTSIFASLL